MHMGDLYEAQQELYAQMNAPSPDLQRAAMAKHDGRHEVVGRLP